MPNLTTKQRIFFLLLTGCLIILLNQRGALSVTRSERPPVSPSSAAVANTSPTPLTTPSPIAIPRCLETGTVQSILGKTYELEFEHYSQDLQQLQCSYQATETVDDIPIRMSYFITQNNVEQEWKISNEQLGKSEGRRTFAGKDNFFAVVNPVTEIKQLTFYVLIPNFYIEVSYSPIKEDVGQMIEKGKHLTEEVVSAVQK